MHQILSIIKSLKFLGSLLSKLLIKIQANPLLSPVNIWTHESLCNVLNLHALPKILLRLTLRRHKKIDVLQNIQKEFITSVFNSFSSPANLSSNLRCDLCLFLFCLRFYTLLCNECLQNSSVRILRISKVQDFCFQINSNKGTLCLTNL